MRCLFLSSFLAAVAVYATQPNALVDLDYARYKGSINNRTGNIEFLGVRYAAPPVGEPTETIGNLFILVFLRSI